jgi:hypothetical protein
MKPRDVGKPEMSVQEWTQRQQSEQDSQQQAGQATIR